ncbi:hypothetical protein EJB05_43239, partial [Eragrostis curvula]
MGTLVGHVAPGMFFLLIGLWQLFSHIRLFLLRPSSYSAPVWFPVPGVRHLELIMIIIGSVISILMELVIVQAKHQPFDDDGAIPSVHLHNFEHASISLAWLVFAAVAIQMDRVRAPMRNAVSQLVAAAASTACFKSSSPSRSSPTLLLVHNPRSIVSSLVRSASLVFQGVWFVVMGVMMWTPSLVPKGCFLNVEDGLEVVRCRTNEALDRAKSLVNLQFSWYLTGTVLFVVVFYLQLVKLYSEELRYVPLVKGSESSRFSIGNEDEDELEVAKGGLGHVVEVRL